VFWEECVSVCAGGGMSDCVGGVLRERVSARVFVFTCVSVCVYVYVCACVCAYKCGMRLNI